MTIRPQYIEKLREARNKALVSNTAQSVFKHLKDLENKRSLVLTRWVWELLQNGRDVAPESGLEVVLTVAPEYLSFQHNGTPFTEDDITHLIFHGSTKQDITDTVNSVTSGPDLLAPTSSLSGFLCVAGWWTGTSSALP